MSKFVFDGVDIVEFARERTTPFYIFGENTLIQNYQKLVAAVRQYFDISKYQIAYSVKNNTLPFVIRSMLQNDCMFEVTSLGEMELLRNLGVPLSKCIYTNIWKPESVISHAINHKLRYFAIDSISDFKHIRAIARDVGETINVLVRVNPAIEMQNTVFASSTPDSKTGVEITHDFADNSLGENAWSLVRLCEKEPCMNLVGLHGHLGSQVVNLDYYRQFSESISKFFRFVEVEIGRHLDILDLGGGIPVSYRNTGDIPSPSDIMAVIASNLTDADIEPNVVLEIGRFITSTAGILVTRIVAVKYNPNVGTIVVTDASAYNDLLDSVLVHWDFDMTIANKFTAPRTEKVWVVGSTTDSIDAYDPLKSRVAHRERFLQRPEEGDILVIYSAGAYTTCFNMNYCLRPINPIYWINQDGTIKTARRKQLLDEMFTLYNLGA